MEENTTKTKKDIISLLYLIIAIINFTSFVILGFFDKLHILGIINLLSFIIDIVLLVNYLKNN